MSTLQYSVIWLEKGSNATVSAGWFDAFQAVSFHWWDENDLKSGITARPGTHPVDKPLATSVFYMRASSTTISFPLLVGVRNLSPFG